MGLVVSLVRAAYQYLSESIEQFPDANKVAHMLIQAGFQHVHHETMLKGLVAVHQGWKKDHQND